MQSTDEAERQVMEQLSWNILTYLIDILNLQINTMVKLHNFFVSFYTLVHYRKLQKLKSTIYVDIPIDQSADSGALIAYLTKCVSLAETYLGFSHDIASFPVSGFCSIISSLPYTWLFTLYNQSIYILFMSVFYVILSKLMLTIIS